MIPANELRIGNCVKCQIYDVEDGYVTLIIESIRRDGAVYCKGYTWAFIGIEPIPLTPEILEKARFVKDENKEHDWINNGYRLRERVGFYSFYRDYEGEDFDYFNDIKHLHQLQNIYFALTGTELEINL